MPSGRTNNFPWKWAWPTSRDHTIFGIRSNISPKLLELETSSLVGGFVLRMPSRRTNNFPESGRGLGHMNPTIFGSTVGYPSDSLASCIYQPLNWSVNQSIDRWLRQSISQVHLLWEHRILVQTFYVLSLNMSFSRYLPGLWSYYSMTT